MWENDFETRDISLRSLIDLFCIKNRLNKSVAIRQEFCLSDVSWKSVPLDEQEGLKGIVIWFQEKLCYEIVITLLINMWAKHIDNINEQ